MLSGAGFGLKQIKDIVSRAELEAADALESHRKVLQKNLARTRRLIGTSDKALEHLKATFLSLELAPF